MKWVVEAVRHDVISRSHDAVSIDWANLQEVTEGTVCTAQGNWRDAMYVGRCTECACIGVLKQFGDVGVAFALVLNADFKCFLHLTAVIDH